MSEHTSKRFAVDLEEIRSKFLRMGGLVEAMILDTVEIFNSGDVLIVDRVLEREKEVNKLEREIDHSIAQVMALQQPTAIDLRMLLSVSKMLTDLERSGDEAEKIAKSLRRLYEDNARYEPLVELGHMITAVSEMLHNTLDSFARSDSVSAATVVRSDKNIDREWRAVLRALSSYMIEDPRLISSAINLMFIARSIERIGDHAKNMSERVIFMVQGEDVRHQGVKFAENVAKIDAPKAD